MSDEERQKFYGTITIEEIQCSDMQFWNGQPSNLTAKLHPTTIPKYQGLCGSCWAFSSAGALETLLLERGFPESEANLSEQFVVDGCYMGCSSPVSCTCIDPGSCYGGNACTQTIFAMKCGLPPEWCRRYVANDEKWCLAESCITEDLIDKNFKLKEAYNVHQNIVDMKSALNEGPLVAIMRAHEDFDSYYEGVYQHIPDYTKYNWHFVEVIGYQDDDSSDYGGGYFICKNSSGTYWGSKLCTRIDNGKYVCKNSTDPNLYCGDNRGYFCIAYNQIDAINGVDFGNLNILYEDVSIPAHYSISGNILTNNPNYSISDSSVFLLHYAGHNSKWFYVGKAQPNSSGAYQFTSVLNWDYRVKPIKDNWCFQPQYQDINLYSNLENVDFSVGYNISGSARIAFTTKPVPNVQIEVMGPISDSTLTDTQGNFIFENMLCGNYVVTATKDNCYFPSSPHNFDLSNSNYNVPTFYCLLKIAGKLGPIYPSNSTITVTGTATNGEQVNQTTTIDSSGNFTFYLPEGNYKFTPSSECMVYNPAFLQANVVYGENISLNFTSSSWQICSSCYSTYFTRELECKSLNEVDKEACLIEASNEFKGCIFKKTSDANSSLYNAIILSIQVQRAKEKPEEVIESFEVESEGDYFINITNGDNLNKDTTVSSAEVNLIGYAQLFGPQDFNKNVFQLKKQIHLLPGEYQISTIVKSKPGSYLTIVISNRDISSFQNLP